MPDSTVEAFTGVSRAIPRVVNEIVTLVRDGYADRILMSHDIGFRNGLRSFAETDMSPLNRARFRSRNFTADRNQTKQPVAYAWLRQAGGTEMASIPRFGMVVLLPMTAKISRPRESSPSG